jgi:flagellar hook-associated protein 3 FlgL
MTLIGYPVSGSGLLGQLVADGGAVRQRLDTLTEQLSTGKIATTYAGLGEGARVSLDLNPAIAHQEAWQSGIDHATGNLQVTQTAMTQMQQIASSFYAKLPDLSSLSSTEVDNVAASARDALKQVAGLLDTKNGDNYVFGGQDSQHPPVPQPDDILSSGFYTQIAGAVGNLTASGASATVATTLATASSNAAGTSPFSAFLSQPAAALASLRGTVTTGDGQNEPVGILASGNTSAISQGGSTTGSYTRDLMRSLATLGSLNSGQLGDASNFQALVADTRSSLGGAISAMAVDAGALGDAQTRLGTMKTQLGDTETALKAQAEDVDFAATISSLQQVQTQMQASYQLIAGLNSLSLVKYLPVA